MKELVEKMDAEINTEEAVLSYHEPVVQLLALGDIREIGESYDYLALGLTLDDVPELIRVLRDDGLYWSDLESERWASIHAAHALGQLRAESAVDALVANLSKIDNDDWIMEDYPAIFGQIGPAALPALQESLHDSTNDEYQRVFSAEAVEMIAKQHPDERDRCVALLADQLRLHAEQSEWLNATLINNLVELDGREAAPVMAEAFEANHVDLSLMGDWEEIQIALGLLTERLTPKPKSWLNWMPEGTGQHKGSAGARLHRPAQKAAERLLPAQAQQVKQKKRKQDKLGRKQSRQNKIKKKKK